MAHFSQARCAEVVLGLYAASGLALTFADCAEATVSS